MRIGLIGYGKMGKEIEALSVDRGHSIYSRIDFDNPDELSQWQSDQVDVAIEFTAPALAFNNIKTCLDLDIPVVCGTTGWLERKKEIEGYCTSRNGTFFYASNFSLGVNITFRVNRFLAQIMNQFKDFRVSMEEIHHTEKKDAPSGTAITLAEGLIDNMERLNSWTLGKASADDQVSITSLREGIVPGTHTVLFQSPHDRITLRHEALNRTGFALGAVLVAEWIQDRQGVLSMNDFLAL